MARGPKKHLKRLNAPRHWMLDKLGGTWAPRPSTGPHKLRECLPLCLVLRNRLRYALTRRETMMIVMRRSVQVDHHVRTDINYPAGFQDIISIPKKKLMKFLDYYMILKDDLFYIESLKKKPPINYYVFKRLVPVRKLLLVIILFIVVKEVRFLI